MAWPASVRFSDSGTSLDPGLRGVLEGSFAVDLSGIRLHAGPRTDAFLRARGYPAATSGHHVFMTSRRESGSERWLHILAHEITHAIQQAQGIAQGDGFWERHAEAAARAITSGQAYPDTGLRPPGRGHGACVLAGFNSWEHRLLGDVPAADLVRIATKAEGWQDLVAQQIRLMRLWHHGGTEVTEQSIRAIAPGIGLVTLPGSGCLATYGEINAMADYAANVEAVTTLPATYMFAFLQQIRQESFNCLSDLLGIQPRDPDFTGAVTRHASESERGLARETRLIDTFTLPLGVNHYQGLLARNACHFAPFAWQRWRQAHTAAREFARTSWESSAPDDKESLATLAWVAQGYADHFLQDSFAPGHLANKTLVMQWFVEWAKDSLFVQVKDWNDVRLVTAGNQPMLMGTPLYDSAHPGPSNDPQAAEEQAGLAARLAATCIQAYGSMAPEQAYRQYLRFLEATAVQLSSKRVHDHFNEHGLDVTSSGHPGLFRIYGDGKLLSDGTDVSIVADTLAASRAVISDVIANGRSRTAPREIIDMLPSRVVGSAGRPTSLPDWHEGDLKRQARDLFGGARSVFLGVRLPSLGIVSEDQRTAGLHQVWETSLGTNAVVTPYWDGQRLFAGSGGQACQLDPSSGQILHTRRLSGYSEVCFQSSGDTVFIGSNGRVLAVDATNLGTTKWTTTLQPLAAFAAVNILYAGDGYLYAACTGCLYALDPASGHVIDQNGLPGLGSDEVRLAATADLLLAATGNVIVCMAREKISAEKWRQSLPSQSPTANILVVGQTLYAASDGYCLAGEPRDGPTTDQIEDGPTGEVRLAADAASLYCGGNGAVTARPLAGISRITWDAVLTSTPTAPVNLRAEGVNVFAATDGYLYQLSPVTGAVQFSIALTSQGQNECRMTSDGVRLYCGIHGHVAGVKLDPA